ncbi:hypothetical protein D3C81_1946980 [compost metagenome]
MDIALQCSGRGPLDHRTVRKRIGIRHAQLQNIRPCRFQLGDNLKRSLQIRIANSQERNQRCPALLLQPAEGHIHPVRRFGCHHLPAPSV